MRAVEVYRLTRKKADLPWNVYVCRPLAAVVVALLEHTRITPNQVTLAAFVVAGAGAAVLASWPGYVGLIVGVLIYEASYVLDCVDGMLARLRNQQSVQGHLLDFLMDEIKAFVILACVSARLYFEHVDVRFLLLGMAGLVCLASGVAITTFERRPEIAGEPKPAAEGETAPKPGWLRRAVALPMWVAKLLIHYPSYIWLAAAAGHIEAFFFPYIAVNALYLLKALAGVALRFGRS